MPEKNAKILYLHGRPGPHPLHDLLARSVSAVFYPVDKIMRWQDRDKTILYRMFSSFVNALLYPLKDYDMVLVDNLHFSPIIARKLRFMRKRKWAVHLGSHTLFFLYVGRYSPFVTRIHLWALKNYDVLICEGEMAKELVYKLLPDFKGKVEVSFLGPKRERHSDLNKLPYAATSRKLLVLANGPGEFRKYYKGLDIMLEAFAAVTPDTSLLLEIVGEWDEETKELCLSGIPDSVRKQIVFTGHTNRITDKLRECCLMLHCSRGDAFPTSTIEAMAAGVPVLVSDWTGTRQLVRQIDEAFIVELDKAKIAERIEWFLNLSAERKQSFSAAFREISSRYSEELAVQRYQEIIHAI
ncbi:MAG: glycosyltransferase [Sediminibacterium sp.]|nr:glycosyltransferase [Sediminibacterium sp.]